MQPFLSTTPPVSAPSSGFSEQKETERTSLDGLDILPYRPDSRRFSYLHRSEREPFSFRDDTRAFVSSRASQNHAVYSVAEQRLVDVVSQWCSECDISM
jgi:hypothetical protein